MDRTDISIDTKGGFVCISSKLKFFRLKLQLFVMSRYARVDI